MEKSHDDNEDTFITYGLHTGKKPQVTLADGYKQLIGCVFSLSEHF